MLEGLGSVSSSFFLLLLLSMLGWFGVLGAPDGQCSGLCFAHISRRILLLWLTRCVYRKSIFRSSTVTISSVPLCWVSCVLHPRRISLHLKPDQVKFHNTHSTPTLFATPCLGSSTLDEEAMTSKARKIALRRSTVSRRGSLSCLIGMTKGGGRAGLARSLVFVWIFFFVPSLLLEGKSIGFTATVGFILGTSCCRDCCCCFS